MPEMSGADVIEKFGDYLQDKMIPIIMYTSVYDDEKKFHLLDSLSLYGAYAPVSSIPKSNPEKLLEEIPLQLGMKELNDELTKEERDEKQALDDVLKFRSLDIDQLPYDPEWLRLLELNCKQSGDKTSEERYKRMREDYLKKKGTP
jgi:response regulator RpfG family c-di-GMP phosphodiesterase